MSDTERHQIILDLHITNEGVAGIEQRLRDWVSCHVAGVRQYGVFKRPYAKSIREWCTEVHANSRNKGFYEDFNFDWFKFNPGEPLKRQAVLEVATRLALITSELAEALEELRLPTSKHNMVYREEEGGKPCGFASELADAVIRCFDLAAAMNIDLQGVIEAKAAYNKTREQKHGGKQI